MKDGQEEAPGRSGDGGKNFRTAQGQVSTKELGVVNGTEERNLRYAAEDTKGLAEARTLAAEYGLELVAFEGGNLTINSTSGVFEARAFIDGNRVCVRADHPKFSLLQLLKHEIAHRKIQKSKVDMKKVYKAVVNFATEEYVKHVIANYVAAYSSLEGYDADYILEEILCDYEAGMNIFSEEDVPASFWEMAQEILQSEDVKTDTARGPPTNWKASRDTKQEVGYGQKGRAEDHASFLRRVHEGSRRVKQIGEIVCAYEPARAIDTSGTVSDAAREFRRLGIKYFYHNGLEYNQNGITYVDNGALCTIEQQVVAIYAKAFGDGTVPTPLYAVGWKKADVAYKKLTEFMEVEDNGINRNGIRFGKGLKIVPDKQGKTSFSVYANGNRISTDGADSFPVRTSASDGRGDSRSSTENSNPEIKFSPESRKVNTFLRHFTGEVREGEYIWLSNVEAATIKSNIKSRDTYLNKDASGGLVWAHSATKQYAYVFICNPDYSATVTDVYDADSDIDTINRTTERMINYARTGSDIRRNSSINGQQRNGNQPSYTGSRSNAETRQSQGNKGMVGQSSQSDRQGSMGAGQQNRTNSGTDATRNASKVKFSREFVQAQMTEQERLLEQANKALERDNAKLQEDVKDLKALLKLQRSVTGGTKFTQSSVEAAAKMLKGKAQAKGSTSDGGKQHMSREFQEGWNSYELSAEFLREVSNVDRHSFLRSLANQTVGIEEGKTRRIIISGMGTVYFFNATGYMNGSIDMKVRITNKNQTRLRDMRKEYINGIDTSRETFDQMAQGYELQRGRGSWHRLTTGNVEETRRNDVVDVETSRSNTLGPDWESVGYSSWEELIEAVESGAMVMDENGDIITLEQNHQLTDKNQEGNNQGPVNTELKTSREFQESNGTQITKGMSDAERYAVLKDKKISLKAKVNTEALRDVESKIGQSTDVADMISLTERKKLFRRLGEEFGVFKGYENADVNLIFEFSKNNMRESTNKQRKNYADFAKMFSCFDDVIDNAIGIEIHNRNADGYKVDPTLKDTYVLVSAFEDGENIVPVKLEIKEFSDKKNALYVAIALEGIKKDEVIKQGNTENGVTQSSRSSTISLADLFEKINPGDESFLKYVPRQFLESKSYVSDGLKKSREATATPVTTAATDTHIEDISVQRSIRDTLGTVAVKYFVDLMTDINSSQKSGRHENKRSEFHSACFAFLNKAYSKIDIDIISSDRRVILNQFV